MKNIFFLLLIILILAPVGLTGKNALFQNGQKHVSWKYSIKKVNDTEFDLQFKGTSEKDWHFYTLKDELNPILFHFKKSGDYKLMGNVTEFPAPKKEYEKLMEANRSFYEKEGTFTQRIKVILNRPFKVSGNFEYQGCFLDGMCVMENQNFIFNIEPVQSSFVNVNDSIKSDSLTQLINNSPDTSKSSNNVTENYSKTKDNSSNDYQGMSLWAFFLTAFFSGLIALMTPCIYPMIPITISFFMSGKKSKRKAITQVIIYGLSIIFIYEIIGTLVALTLGESFSNWLSTHWLPNILFCALFLLFAASFFGMFEITLPGWLINKSDKQADKGGYIGAFFMAFTLVLVSFSCTAPIAGAILAFSTQGMVIKPVVGMLGYSLAFAIPFTFFAVFPTAMKSLPKSGGWLNALKVVIGFINLAFALKFLSVADQSYNWHILDREVYLSFWIVIFSLMGIYLLGKLKFSHDSEMKFISVPRLMLAVISFSFVVYMIPGLWGAPLKALAGWIPAMTTQEFDINGIVRDNVSDISVNTVANNSICEEPEYAASLKLSHGLKGYFDYNQALACAKVQNKPVFIDFKGHGCVNCKKMEETVLAEKEVLKKLKNNFIVVDLYVDDHNIELLQKDWFTSKDGSVKKMMGEKNFSIQTEIYRTNGQPYYFLVDANGDKLISPRGGYNPDVNGFIKFLDNGLAEFKKRNVTQTIPVQNN